MRTLGRMRVTFGGGRDPGLTARRVVGPYKDVGPESMVRRGGCPHPPADHGECSLNVRAGEDTGPYGICGNLFKYRRGRPMCPPHAFPWGKVPNKVRRMRGTPSMTEYIPLNVRAGEDTGPCGICKTSGFAVGAAHQGRPRDTFISRPGAGRPCPRSSSAAPPGRAPPSPPAWGPPPRGPGRGASR